MGTPSRANDQAADQFTGSEPAVPRTVDSSAMEAADALAPRALRPHLILSACFGFPLAACGAVWGATFNVGSMNSMVGRGGIEAAISPAFAAAAGCILFAWIIVSFRPLRESLADGATVLEDGAEHAEAVATAIRECATTRCRQPFQTQPQDLDGIPALAVRNGAEHGLVTVRALGPDLFVGWSLWRRRSTARLLGQVLNNLTEPARENPHSAVAASSLIIMREQLHCMTREGLKAGSPATDTRNLGR